MAAHTQETFIVRVLPLLAAVIPCVVSILLLSQVHHRYGYGFTTFVQQSRTGVQIAVQVLAHGLGLAQVYSLRGLYKLHFRLDVFDKTMTLEKLSFSTSLANGQLNLSLTKQHLMITIFSLAIFLVPSALWTGALTPVVLPGGLAAASEVYVPAFSQNTNLFWNNEFYMSNFTQHNNPFFCQGSGTVTTCPVPRLQGTLLTTLGSATSPHASVPRQHSKIDSPSYVYSGRSHGVGAPLGIADSSDLYSSQFEATIQELVYTDYGYVADTQCIFNTSTAFGLTFLGQSVAAGIPMNVLGVYSAAGFLPNSFDGGIGDGVGENFTVITNFEDPVNDLLSWAARTIGSRIFISIAAGPGVGNYSIFNQSQCELTFTRPALEVSMDYTNLTITVEPRQLLDNETSYIPNATIIYNTVNSLNLLSRMSSSFYTSVLGDALAANLANTLKSLGPNASVNDSVIFSSLEASFNAVLVDIMGAFGASQIALANDVNLLPATIFQTVSSIGDLASVYTVFAFSALLLVIQLLEAIRRRFWSKLVVFDVFDIPSLIIATSVGGVQLSKVLDGRETMGDEKMAWSGKASDKALGSLGVRLHAPSETYAMPALVSVDSGKAEEPSLVPVSGTGEERIPMLRLQSSSSQANLIKAPQVIGNEIHPDGDMYHDDMLGAPSPALHENDLGLECIVETRDGF